MYGEAQPSRKYTNWEKADQEISRSVDAMVRRAGTFDNRVRVRKLTRRDISITRMICIKCGGQIRRGAWDVGYGLMHKTCAGGRGVPMD